MGNNLSKKKKQIKCHIIIKKWNNVNDIIIEKRNNNNINDKNYLLTLSGNLFIQKNRYDWISKYENNKHLDNITILNFNLNSFEKKKKFKSIIKNTSKLKNHYNQSIWELLNFKKENKKGIKIKENEVFRIGKQIMKLKMMILEKDKKKFETKISKAEKSKIFSQEEKKIYDIINNLPSNLEKELVCRICLDKETKKNRFHNFCPCIKTMPSHLSCLQEWLKKNIIINESNGIKFYNFLNICCDICQNQFPSTYKNDKGDIIPLIKPKFPKGCSFVILEIYLIEKPQFIKALMIFDMSVDRVINIGRDEENDIIFKHTSISRDHCAFFLKRDGFFLFDKGSKFGSFLLFDKKIKLKKKRDLIFKIQDFIVQVHPFKKDHGECLQEFRKGDLKKKTDPYKLDFKYNIDNARKVQSMKVIKKDALIGSSQKFAKVTSINNIDNMDKKNFETNDKKSENEEISEESDNDVQQGEKNSNNSYFGSILEKSHFSKKISYSNEGNFITSFGDTSIGFKHSENFEISGLYAFN